VRRIERGLMGQSSVEWRKPKLSFHGGYLRVSTFDSQPTPSLNLFHTGTYSLKMYKTVRGSAQATTSAKHGN
jgi:hypothetical protein